MAFLRNILSTIIGLFVSLFLIVLFFIAIIAVFSGSDKPHTSKNSFLEIPISGVILDRNIPTAFEAIQGNGCGGDLISYTKALQKAQTDPKIDGVILNISEITSAPASIQSLRRSIQAFKSSGKPVYAITNGTSQFGYYLMAAADSIFMEPVAHIEWKGLGAQLLYFRSLLEKAGIKAETIRAGKFKSAIEPFVQDSISDENHYQVETLLTEVWGSVISDLAQSTGKSETFYNNLADEKGFLLPREALSNGFIHGIKYEDEVKNAILKGATKHFLNFNQYNQFNEQDQHFVKEKIAVVYAEGAIIDGYAEYDISGDRYVKLLQEIEQDNHVKAMVLRINSPGGSAKASERIWHQIARINEKIPVYVSFGNVAASGGYYMAMASDTIFAEPTTVTGSIGVFGLMFNMNELSNRLGVTVEKINTNKMSDFPSFDRDLSPQEKQRLNDAIDDIYSIFLKRVADGRGKTTQEVFELAEGRVWSGNAALQNGLVDTLGGLTNAIQLAMKTTGLSEKNIVEYPKQLTPIEVLVKHLEEGHQVKLPAPFERYNYLINNPDLVQQLSSPQARLPFLFEFY